MKSLNRVIAILLTVFGACLGQGSELATQSIEFFRPLEGRWVREADGIISHLDINIVKSNSVEIRVESCHETGPLACARALQTYYLSDEKLMARAGFLPVNASVDEIDPTRIAIRYREPKENEDIVHAFTLVSDTLLSLNSKTVEAQFSRGPRSSANDVRFR